MSQKKLKRWRDAGLINEEQLQSILEYENTKHQGKGFVQVIGLLGVVVSLLGVISLIASNWEIIPEFVKLIVAFGILATAGKFAYDFKLKSDDLKFEISLCFFNLFIFAVMALIGQIFHLDPNAREALLFWIIITLPAILYSKSYFNNLLWTIGLSITVILFDLHISDKDTWSFLLPIVYLTAIKIFERFDLLPSLLKSLRINAVLIAVSIVAFGLPAFTYPLDSLWGLFLLLCSSAALIAVVFLSDDTKYGKIFNGLAWLFYIAQAVYAITVYALSSELATHFFNFSVFLLFCTSLAVLSAMKGHKKLFNFFVLVFALRCLVFFFMVCGSLAFTGLSLLMIGLLILFSVRKFFQHRQKLFYYLESLNEQK